MKRLMKRLLGDRLGSMAVETALVAPVLGMVSIGIFEVGLIVARQHELQSAANEVEIIVIATNGGAETTVDELKTILRDSVGLDANQVAVSTSFRCGTASNLVTSTDSCGESDVVSTYVNIAIKDTYTPTWTSWGFGSNVDFSVERTVQIS